MNKDVRRVDEQERQFARERALYVYSSALERADFEHVAAIWREAEHDPLLESMLLELDAELQAEAVQDVPADSAAVVRSLVEEHFGSPLELEDREVSATPLTVADVAARLHADARARADIERELPAIKQLRGLDVPVTDNLSQRDIRRLFEEVGVAV